MASSTDLASLLHLAARPRVACGTAVQEDECQIQSEEVAFNSSGHPFARVAVGISGTIDGWTVRTGPAFKTMVTDGPELIFPQLGVNGDAERCVVKYDYSGGSGMTVFFPLNAEHWNGKLIVTAHGGISYAAVGVIAPAKGFRSFANLNKFVGTMIDKGYAVAHTLRSSALNAEVADLPARFESGEEAPGFQLAAHAGLLTRWGTIARRYVEHRLQRPASHAYLYGYSAGGIQGRLLNYKPSLNDDGDGKRMFDGLLIDDSGAGLPIPIGDPDKAAFVPQIDLTHLLYVPAAGPPFLDNKRQNAKLLAASSVASRHRHYEVHGVSHLDAGYGPEDMGRGRDSVFQSIDLSPLISAMIDRLDEWVCDDIPPPPSRVIDLPETAAPLGVYFVHPTELGTARVGLQTTGFAFFDGRNLEPLDGLGRLVDMNGSGTRETRETLSDAWARLGLVDAGTPVTLDVYVARVKNVASGLADDGLIDRDSISTYVQRAYEAFPSFS